MSTILETSKLSIGYTSKVMGVVAKDISIDLKQGTLVSLVGANGIGKSTLLRTITGIQKPLVGKILLHQKDITAYDTLALSQEISVVLTEKLPPSNLTIYELIALGRQPYTNWIGKLSPFDQEKISEAIALTKLEHLLYKKHFEVSDGQLQKALIARALAQDTPLIVLDEPTTHLDLLHKVSLFKLLKKLTATTQKCILFSTHDIDLAIQMSDEMLVMSDKVITQDTPCQLISKGVFENLFPSDHLKFNPDLGKFIIQ